MSTDREHLYPRLVEPTPEPVLPELAGFELVVPRVEVPRVDIPTVGESIRRESRRAGRTVTLARVGLVLYTVALVHAVVVLALVGVLSIAVRGQLQFGSKLLASSVVVGLYTVYRYHHPPRPPRTRSR
ncbi:hypothetical protein [Salinigranum sp.]|uniref:hypothetical protein n=1 Tax=Salinigranum sp. TaxID=1966351 RepID=UPI003568D9B4